MAIGACGYFLIIMYLLIVFIRQGQHINYLQINVLALAVRHNDLETFTHCSKAVINSVDHVVAGIVNCV